MTVLSTSTIFDKKWLATQIDIAAACPILEGKKVMEIMYMSFWEFEAPECKVLAMVHFHTMDIF